MELYGVVSDFVMLASGRNSSIYINFQLALYPFEESKKVTFARQKGNNSQKSIKTHTCRIKSGMCKGVIHEKL
jgi:orotate phosphoribosyltransferase